MNISLIVTVIAKVRFFVSLFLDECFMSVNYRFQYIRRNDTNMGSNYDLGATTPESSRLKIAFKIICISCF